MNHRPGAETRAYRYVAGSSSARDRASLSRQNGKVSIRSRSGPEKEDAATAQATRDSVREITPELRGDDDLTPTACLQMSYRRAL